MPALLIGAEERAAIAELIAVAAATPLQPGAVNGAAAADVDGFRDMMRTLSIALPVGFRVCYSHEIQPEAPPPGLCHHISISVERPGQLPPVEAVEMIIRAFGMSELADAAAVWVEDIGPGERAVNVVALVRHG